MPDSAIYMTLESPPAHRAEPRTETRFFSTLDETSRHTLKTTVHAELLRRIDLARLALDSVRRQRRPPAPAHDHQSACQRAERPA